MTAPEQVLGGRYEVGELISRTSSAQMHLGRDLRLGRVVVVKVLRNDLARDRVFGERLQREARNAAALNDPTIAAVYDVGEEESPDGEKIPYIVMEFVDGRTLDVLLKQDGPVPWRRALALAADVCAALAVSHRHGIVHRNIKPRNVMLSDQGQVKVMNFGIARVLSGKDAGAHTSAVIGSAQYLSPEQARGEAVDGRSDVYAAGCLVFELLVGRPPFNGDGPVAIAYQHVREDPPAPSTMNGELPPAVDKVVLKALAKNPLDRYQTAQEMRDDLLRVSDAAPEPERSGVFISYRRADAQHVAGRIADQLIGVFGESLVFLDVDSLRPGTDFVDAVRRAVRGSEVLLALIGPQWVDASAGGRRRLDDPADIVALEITEALAGGVHVIPVLIDGAPMPRPDQLPAGLLPLVRRNAFRVAHETFRSDVARLVADLRPRLGTGQPGG